MIRTCRVLMLSCLLATCMVPVTASAADVLLVADATSDDCIAGVLEDDGHTVTVVTNDFAAGNAALAALAPGDYDAVVWIANGSGSGSAHSDASLFTTLTEYVESGGRVFVTGYDTIASPTDPNLIAFIGGTSSSDGASAPGAVLDEDNSLTTGIVDIRGLVPSGYAGDRDTVIGLTAGTVGVVSSGANWQWTLRELGAGEVAYVSNGNSSGCHASWTTVASDGSGAYNGAVRNFVSGAAVGAPRIRWAEGQLFEFPEGGELLLEVTVEDREGDDTITSWDLDGDGEYDDADGTSVTLSGEGLDGPMVLDIDVQSCDIVANCSHRAARVDVLNAPPVITNIPEEDPVVLIGEEFTFTPEVADPGGDEVEIEILDRPGGMVLLPAGGVRWTPVAEDVGEHSITFLVTDDEDDPDIEGDGDATLVLNIIVSENLPPGQPTIIRPENRGTVDTLTPTFEVQTPEDPEGDALTLRYDIDTTDTFSSPDRITGEVQATRGTTAWRLEQELVDGERYHWRVRAWDGHAEGPAATAMFEVETGAADGDGDGDGDADGDADTDGDGDGDGDDDIVVEPGCACRASGDGADRSGFFLLLAAVAGLALRLRRS